MAIAARHAQREYGHRDDQLGRVAEYRFVIVGYGRFDHGAPRRPLPRHKSTRTLTPLYPEGVQRDEALNPGTFSPFAGLWDRGET